MRRRHGFDPWVGKIPWRRKWQPTPVFLPSTSHGQRSLAGYRTRGWKELDTTKQLDSNEGLSEEEQKAVIRTSLITICTVIFICDSDTKHTHTSFPFLSIQIFFFFSYKVHNSRPFGVSLYRNFYTGLDTNYQYPKSVTWCE